MDHISRSITWGAAVTAPVASIIIPVRARRRQLGALLTSIAADRLVSTTVEVVIVDNPAPYNRAWLARGNWPFLLRYVVSREANRGRARNLGAAVSQGQRLIFVDSDVEFGHGSLAALIEASTSNDRSISMPHVRFPPGKPRNLATHLLDVAAYFRRYRRRSTQGAIGFREFVSCIFGVQRGFFELLGGFDTSFLRYGYEDVELALRAERAGAEFQLLNEVAYHLNALAPAGVLRRAFETGESAVRLVQLHPGVEQALPVGVADTRSGKLSYATDYDVNVVLARVRHTERAWLRVRGSASVPHVRALLSKARGEYAEICRYGRFAGIARALGQSPAGAAWF